MSKKTCFNRLFKKKKVVVGITKEDGEEEEENSHLTPNLCLSFWTKRSKSQFSFFSLSHWKKSILVKFEAKIIWILTFLFLYFAQLKLKAVEHEKSPTLQIDSLAFFTKDCWEVSLQGFNRTSEHQAFVYWNLV